jgi:hypothetical protein
MVWAEWAPRPYASRFAHHTEQAWTVWPPIESE